MPGPHRSVDYALTVTLNMRTKSTADQLRSSRDILNDALKDFQHSTVAELTKNNDVHYHSILSYTGNLPRDMSIFIKDRLRSIKGIGYTCVKPVTDYQAWVSYMKKDERAFYDKVGIPPCIHDDYLIHDHDYIFGMFIPIVPR